MDDTTGRVTSPRSEDETQIRTQEIREEIAQTRMEMSETIEAIEERLKPSNLVAQAGETVRNAATEKVKSMANTAGYASQRMMNTPVGQTVRDNPIPIAMIGIGTAWLLMNRRSGGGGRYRRSRDDSRYRTANAHGSEYGYGSGQAGYESGQSAYGSGRTEWRQNTSGAPVGTAGYADYASVAGSESSRVSEFGGEFRPYSRQTEWRSVDFERVVRDNPLVVGAAAALVGVAIGMSLPSSETENRVMGEARDTVVDRVREVAGEAAEKVQDVAGKAAEAVTQVRDAATPATERNVTERTQRNTRPSTSG